MKKFGKIILGVFLLLVVFIAGVFAVNATDDSLSEHAQAMLKDYPDQAGYPLQKLKIRKEDQVPSIDFNDYQDYKKNQSAFDKVLSDHSKNLDSLLEAYNQGHV